MSQNYVQIDPIDNLIVAIDNLSKGLRTVVNGEEVILKENIKSKHKFALKDFNIGDEIFMYGVLVGKAVLPIQQGEAITTENIKHASASFNDSNEQYTWTAPNVSNFEGRTFSGYHRADGNVGTGNYWLVIPLTFCENRNIDVLEGALSEKLGYETKKDFTVDTDALIAQYKACASTEDIYSTPIIATKEELSKNRLFPNVDGIKFLKHDGGCGGIRQDSEVLCNLLAGYISNPNVAGATIFSLGCQNAQIEMLQKALAIKDPKGTKPVHYLEQQKSAS